MLTTRDISEMISHIGKSPSMETQAALQDILDAMNERIDALERAARADRLLARPWKSLAGMKALRKRK